MTDSSDDIEPAHSDEEQDIGRRARALWQDFDSRRGLAAMLTRHTGGRPLGEISTKPQHRPLGRSSGAPRSFPWRSATLGIVTIVAVVIAWRVLPIQPPAQSFREFASATGSRATIVLRDGTRLVLGPASRVRVAADFGIGARTVELDGEAVFTVVHDTKHPFLVHTAHADVHDVGTTFAVRAYVADPDEQVAVTEGEVTLAGAALRARDVATIDAIGRMTVRHGVDVAPYADWAQGRLVFEDTPLRDAVRTLNRTYKLNVTIADSSLAGQLVTASFTDESVDEVLDVITRVISARYERNGRTVTIRRRTSAVWHAEPADRARLNTAANTTREITHE